MHDESNQFLRQQHSKERSAERQAQCFGEQLADDPPASKLEKIEALVSMATPQIERVVPLIAALLSTPAGGRYLPLSLSPAQQHRQTLAALLDQLEGLARRNPVLVVFEDAHWADATSLELLDLTIERVRQLPILALITFRPEFERHGLGSIMSQRYR